MIFIPSHRRCCNTGSAPNYQPIDIAASTGSVLNYQPIGAAASTGSVINYQPIGVAASTGSVLYYQEQKKTAWVFGTDRLSACSCPTQIRAPCTQKQLVQSWVMGIGPPNRCLWTMNFKALESRRFFHSAPHRVGGISGGVVQYPPCASVGVVYVCDNISLFEIPQDNTSILPALHTTPTSTPTPTLTLPHAS
jgi:hypothetical protein